MLHVAPALALLCLLAPPPTANGGDALGSSSAHAVSKAAATRAAVLERLIELGQNENQAAAHLTWLSEEIGHRLTSSTNLERAERWAVERFEEFGLEARLEEWGEFDVGFDRMGERGGMLRPAVVPYVVRTPAWSPGTPGPLRGRAVLEPKDADGLAQLGDLRGAWLVKRPRGDTAAREVRRGLPDRLRAAPILGTISDGGEPMQVFGRSGIEWDELPRDVEIRIRRDQHTDLVERLERGEDVELEFDVDNRFREGPIALHNVVAEIAGSDLADEVVIVGGHIDSWHCAQGTQDNGTGVVTTLEAARLLVAAGAQPRRTIRFMLWSGEEQGLLGSKAYVAAQDEDFSEKVNAVLVHDGGTNYVSGIAGPAPMVGALREAFAPAVGLSEEMPFEVTENSGLSGGGSDHGSFLRVGIPGFFWRQAGRADYGYVWHTQYDVLENAVTEYVEHSALVIAIGALGLANSEAPLDRRAMRRPSARRMGVYLEDTSVSGVTGSGRAQAAGWQEGDRIVSIDGVEVATRREIVDEIQKGGPVKSIVLEREGKQVETTMDWSDDPDEEERREHARLLAEARDSVGGAGEPAEADAKAEAEAETSNP